MPIFQLNKQIVFPSPELAEPDGLLAVGGDLSPERLIAAYRLGIFPWFSDNDPILWWFIAPRLVLYPEELNVPGRLRRQLRKGQYTITFDRAFSQVIQACVETRLQKDEPTWITDDMREGYTRLHRLGYAHSVECWQDDTLAGGLYGLTLGQVFFGESMFTRVSNCSKICFVHLVKQLRQKNIKLIDCQMTSQHLLQFGTRELSGTTFRRELQTLIQNNKADGPWTHDNPTNPKNL